MEMGIGKRT